MALKQSSEALRRPPWFLLIGVPVLSLLSLALGFVGLHEYVPRNQEVGHRIIDIIYYDLQLFVLGSDPLQSKGPFPLTLDIARFCAPAVTVYAAVEAIRLLLAVELSRWRAFRARGHSIVCGDTPFADALTRKLRADGVEVVEIRAGADEFVSPGEPLRIIGDARDHEVLRSAGVERARSLYACTEDSAANIAIAMATARAVSPSPSPIFTYSLIGDPDLCATMQAFYLGQPKTQRVRSDFFNLEQIAARRLFRELHLQSVQGRPVSLLIAGVDAFAQALLTEAARSWRLTRERAGDRLIVTMIGEGAAAITTALRQRLPVVDETCRVQSLEEDLLPLIRRGALQPFDHVLVTYPNEEQALQSALTIDRYWQGRTRSVTVRLDGALVGVSSKVEALAAATQVQVFGAVGGAADPDLIRDDLIGRIARVLHDRYLEGRRSRGDLQGGRALMGWDDLPHQIRLENRSQAEDIGRKLAQLGYTITPRLDGRRLATLSEPEIDQLAAMEHERWRREHGSSGWRYAPDLDERRQLHPGMLVWDDLPQTMRLRAYDPIRVLPRILADAGFQIVRTQGAGT